ncbi:MAG: hypothetical protein H6727_09325 [Myxococcales bacterium]|nr:hypothetical protein [Myxococcales bacterium]
MFNLWEAWLEIFQKALPCTYDQSGGQGIPAPAVWRDVVVRSFDGRAHCSGAVWWALLALLREHTDLETELDFSHIEHLRKAAWIEAGYQRSGLPLALAAMGLGTYTQTIPQQGDICQAWRARSGHLFICAGTDEQGNLLEWSASESHLQGTGIKPFVGTIREIHAFRFDRSFFQ